MINELSYTVNGRPAPQGSKKHGAAGQMLEQSPYLAPWRQAVKRATYQHYVTLGIMPDALPVLRGPVEIGLRFRLAALSDPAQPPDLDKLMRAVWDALTHACVWEDDGRVVRVLWAEKLASGPTTGDPGCDIYVRAVRPAGMGAIESVTRWPDGARARRLCCDTPIGAPHFPACGRGLGA